MIATLPMNYQEQVVDHLLVYIEDMREDVQWNESFAKSQDGLVAMAKQAKIAITEGKAPPMNICEL